MKSNRWFGRAAGVLLLFVAGHAAASPSMNRALFNEGYQMIFQFNEEGNWNTDGAIAVFDRVIAEDSVPDDPALWQVFAWRGYAYALKGAYAKDAYARALADFDKALSMKENPEFRAERAAMLLYSRRYQEAFADSEKALKSLTGAERLGTYVPFWQALQTRAISLVYLGEYRKAVDAFNRYDQAVPGATNQMLFQRGAAYYHLDRLDEARAVADKELEQSPVLQIRFSGENKLEMFELEKRRAAVKKALEAAKKEEEAGQLASAFKSLQEAWSQDFEFAGEIRECLIRLYPKLKAKPDLPGAARRNLVQAKMFVKRQEKPGDTGYYKARDSNITVEGIAPWYPDAYYNEALTLAQLKQYGQAIANMRIYLRLAPGASDAQAAQDKIYEWQASPVGMVSPPTPPLPSDE